ncbi:MAG: phosphotransferase [Nocardioidaceae bacterium]
MTRATSPLQSLATDDERSRALAILDDLARSSGDHALCHGDAQPGNILLGVGGQLYFVDARGILGEPAYDAAVLAVEVSDEMERRRVASVLAKRVGLDHARVQAWLTIVTAARV